MTTQRRRAEELSLQGPPPFAGAVVEENRCRLCRCHLSQYNHRGDGLCESCASGLRELDGEALATLIAGIMLSEIALRGPGRTEPINVRERLLAFGVIADATRVNEAVRKCRRRRIGLLIESGQWRRGYRPVKVEVWRRPRKRPSRTGKASMWLRRQLKLL